MGPPDPPSTLLIAFSSSQRSTVSPLTLAMTCGSSAGTRLTATAVPGAAAGDVGDDAGTGGGEFLQPAANTPITTADKIRLTRTSSTARENDDSESTIIARPSLA